MADRPCILFTAFEPSGDEHAAPVIRELQADLPDVPIYALGGPKMRAAGATLVEETTGDAAMLGSAVGKVFEHQRLRRRLDEWMCDLRVAVHVPTDSPAANWGVCRMTKRRGAKVVHLVAPQVWAWAPWRVRRLRKWSDLVLCILPFEPRWFAERGVTAIFIGHPLFDEPLDTVKLDEEISQFPSGSPKVALLPGSRPGEIRRNVELMDTAFDGILKTHPGAVAVAAAADRGALESIAGHLHSFPPPSPIKLVLGQMDAIVRWADVVLTASGTATLHVARHGKPMVIVYGVNAWTWRLIGRWILRTRTFTLPNLIAMSGPSWSTDAHIVHEFVPFTAKPSTTNVQPVVDELVSLIENKDKARRQVDALGRVVEQFRGYSAGREAAEAIAQMYERTQG